MIKRLLSKFFEETSLIFLASAVAGCCDVAHVSLFICANDGVRVYDPVGHRQIRQRRRFAQMNKERETSTSHASQKDQA